MNKIANKILAVLAVSLFVFSATSSAYSVNVNVENQEKYSESNQGLKQKTATIYRVNHDGTIMPIEIDVEEDAENLGEFLEKKCDELFEKDIELQEYIKNLQTDNNNTTGNFSVNYGIIRIKSHGKGFHFKTKTHVKITARFKLFKLMLPRLRITAKKCLVFASYTNDSKAKTTFYPLIRSSYYNDTNLTVKVVQGPHYVITTKFIGYTTWVGRFSNILFDFDLIPRAFSGIGRLVICKSY